VNNTIINNISSKHKQPAKSLSALSHIFVLQNAEGGFNSPPDPLLLSHAPLNTLILNRPVLDYLSTPPLLFEKGVFKEERNK
jgi:hypothetical protein